MEQNYSMIIGINKSGAAAQMARSPKSDSEEKLFRLLQRANLLDYFDLFIKKGGDDIQQLYDAYQAQSIESSNGEKKSEFIEIMEIIGMWDKPLHVKRLEKALKEWGANPDKFQLPVQQNFIPNHPPILNRPIPMLPYNSPLNSISNRSNGLPNHAQSSIMHNIIPTTSSLPGQLNVSAPMNSVHSNKSTTSSPLIPTTINPALMNSSSMLSKPIYTVTRSLIGNGNLCQSPTGNKNDAFIIHQTHLPVNQILKAPTNAINNLNMASNLNANINNDLNVNLNNNMKADLSLLQSNCPMGTFTPVHLNGQNVHHAQQNQQNENEQIKANSPICMTNALKDDEIQKITDCAVKLTEAMKSEIDTRLEPIRKDLETIGQKKEKKKSIRNVMHILNMPEDHPERAEEMRKYGSIYGRIDCRRKAYKPLSLHEVYVNEAALQLCKLKPLLLADRQALFILAREVVKQAEYKFSKGRSRSQWNYKLFDELNGESSNQTDGNENNDSIDIETYKDDDEKEYESDMSNSDLKSDCSKSFAGLKDQLLNSGNNGLNARKNSLFREELTSRSTNQNDQEECKRKLDQLDMINKQIDINNLQINELRMSKEVNEVRPKLIKLEDDLKLLIEEKNNLLKKIQKLDSLTLSPKAKNVKTLNSDSEDETNSQASVYSRASSKDDQNGTNSLNKSSLLQFNQSTNSDNVNNSSHCSSELISRSTLKRKLLDCTSPQNKFMKSQKSDDENKIYIQPDEDRNGIDLRIQIIGNSNNRKEMIISD